MKITFLHVSDLHYRPDWDEEVELVFRQFAIDVSAELPKRENVYMVFSGDFVFSGSNGAAYDALLNRLEAVLSGVPPDRRIAVPGNHDVSREAFKASVTARQGALGAMSSEKLFNENLDHLASTYMAEAFSNYLKAENRFAKFGACQNGLAGQGWDLGEGVALYALNSALCSSAGLPDANGAVIPDRQRLMVATRDLYRWVGATNGYRRVLVMHHPTSWLVDWAREELDSLIANEFSLVFTGHEHRASTVYATRGNRGNVHVSAPPLFTTKSNPLLGYAFVVMNTADGSVAVEYRQWSPARKFVKGTSLAGNDSGVILFPRYEGFEVVPEPRTVGQDDTAQHPGPEALLKLEFQEAAISYSSKRTVWVDRDLSSIPENKQRDQNVPLITQDDLLTRLRDCVIKAPRQFGLTCLGRYIALSHCQRAGAENVIVFLDAEKVPPHRQGVMEALEGRCRTLGITRAQIAAIVLDNISPDKRVDKVISEIRRQVPDTPMICLHSLDDAGLIGGRLALEELADFEIMYLWALSRRRVRELVAKCIDQGADLDETMVTSKIVRDLEALNIHRTPLNCLLILKLAEQLQEDSPVNRTEMIGRVLTLLFFQFNRIPTYATRPDLKDCEFALGYFCETLVRQGRTSFAKEEFYKTVQDYCSGQMIEIDIEILFSFLASENILVRKGYSFEFRFNYWLYYFAAHRMHHSPEFASFILTDRRYSAYPELIEFYAGIDRRRVDAVTKLTEDLRAMNEEFLDRAQIPSDFDPYSEARWSPDADAIAAYREAVNQGVQGSSLPEAVKDAMADTRYDRTKPYDQALATFFERASVRQLIKATKGASRVLRNSDHVPPVAKAALLEQVVTSWVRQCQLLVLLSPLLVLERRAQFEDMSFVLGRGFEGEVEPQTRWTELMASIPGNVTSWFEEDLSSRRLGVLLSNFIRQNEGTLGQFLILETMVHHRPKDWDKEVQRFIVRSHKNSFFLERLYITLMRSFKYAFINERTQQEMLRLAGMAVAKHETGAKHPNAKLVEKVARALEEKLDTSDASE